jgi:hypothetical protein
MEKKEREQRMSEGALTKITIKTSRELAQNVTLSDPAKALLQEKQSPAQYLKELASKGHLPDAIQVLAFALPKREAVGWAFQCAREAYGPKPEPKLAAALEAARRWVTDPTEEKRRQAKPAADEAGYGAPAGLCAAAAFWSGGSLGPADQKPIPPDEKLTAKGVGGAVLLAGMMGDAAQAMDRLRRFLELGLEVARGASPWKN